MKIRAGHQRNTLSSAVFDSKNWAANPTLAPKCGNGSDEVLMRGVAAEVTRLYLTTIDRPLAERRRIVAEALGLD